MPIYLPRLTMLVVSLAALGVSLSMLTNALLWLWMGTILIIAVLIWKRAPFCLMLVAVVPILFFVYAQFRVFRPTTHDLSYQAGRHVIFRARLISELSDLGNGRWRAVIAPYELIFPNSGRLIGKANLVLQQQPTNKSPDLLLGDNIEARALVNFPQKQQQPWQFDLAAYLQKQSIFCSATVFGAELRKLEGRNSSDLLLVGQRTIDVIRNKIVQAHAANLGDRAGTLLSSMVLGDKTVTVDPGIISDFRNVGLTHLIAASGFNLAVVAAASFWLARCILPARMFVTCLTLLNMALFVAFAGLSPSVLRAVSMCLILIAATHFYRSVNGLAAVGLALLVTILIDPSSISDPGCQLSFSATIGIICGAKYTAELFLPKEGLTGTVSPGKEPIPKRIILVDKTILLAMIARIFSWFVESLSVVLCAQAAIMPVQLFHFWRIGLLFLPANLLVAPLVTPVTVLGFASSFLAPLSFDGKTTPWSIPCWFLDMLAALPLKAILTTSRYFASIKQALISFGPPSSLSIVLYYFSLLTLMFSLRIKRWRISCLVLFLIGGFLLFWRPSGPKLTIALFSNATVVFGEDHQGICIGERQGSVEKFLSYYGVRTQSESVSNSPVPEILEGRTFFQCKILSDKHTYTVLLQAPSVKSATQLEKGHIIQDFDGDTSQRAHSGSKNAKSSVADTRLLVLRVPEGLLRQRQANLKWEQPSKNVEGYVGEQKRPFSRTGRGRALQNWFEQVKRMRAECDAKFLVLVECESTNWHPVKSICQLSHNSLPELNLVTDHNLHAYLSSDTSVLSADFRAGWGRRHPPQSSKSPIAAK